MELFVNELSLHEQFPDIGSFHKAFERLMQIRSVAGRFDCVIHCDRAFLNARPLSNTMVQQAISRFPQNERRAVLLWLTREGPFWNDSNRRRHDPSEYLECRDILVTDTGIGEAAYESMHGIESGLVSFTPSDWDFSPVTVSWRRDAGERDDLSANLENWRDATLLETELHKRLAPIGSWNDLQSISISRFQSLTFARDCFEPLVGIPFVRRSANHIISLLDVLDRLAQCFDSHGQRTPRGQRIYQNHFMGDNAWFSDSSKTEKRKFRKELTFSHPDDGQETLFCTWHGKERHLVLRLHFSWPIQANEPIYVVYVGPKITKK